MHNLHNVLIVYILYMGVVNYTAVEQSGVSSGEIPHI